MDHIIYECIELKIDKRIEAYLHYYEINGLYICTIRKEKEKDSTMIGGGFYVYPAPTGNCQLFSISMACNIIDAILNKNIIPIILRIISRQMAGGREIALMDLNIHKVAGLKRSINNNSIIMETNYTSTNGSLMTIILVNTADA